jgi:23S rRNA (adenine2503-C2)-methyltransferase
MMSNILEMNRAQLTAWMCSKGQPSYRADQLWQWLWNKGMTDFAGMANLPKPLRNELAAGFDLKLPKITKTLSSQDGTLKFLLRLADGQEIETVLIPNKGHLTQCLSSQVGCAMGCTFCSTGQMGLTRNMTFAEIAGQVLVAREYLIETQQPRQIRNLVFMGMGEPLLNWDNLSQALEIFTAQDGLDFSPRRITVSSIGLAQGLERLKQDRRASLAISLHAPDQSLRELIMPKPAKLLPLDALLGYLRSFPLAPRQRITIEYLLLGGINDQRGQAVSLVRALNGIRCKVNLIPFNPGPGLRYQAPEPNQVLRFEDTLRSKGLTVTVRKSKGQDISAACGQLKTRQKGP